MAIGDFEPGATIVVQERWRGMLWSAVPHRVVADGEWLITFVPAGAVEVHATNRGLPAAAGMTRSERKLEALRTGVHTAMERRSAPATLHFFRPGSWARVIAGWDLDASFTGWYVNFERPFLRRDDGLETKDLVLDALVDCELCWHWKDRTEFDTAVSLGVLSADLDPTLATAADVVRSWLASRTGPFDRQWRRWRADPDWPAPELPAGYRPGDNAPGGFWRDRLL